MTYLYFNDDITTIPIVELSKEIQQTEGEIKLYFSTHGGEINLMRFLIDVLNSRKEEITVVLTDIVGSAGTLLLTEFEGKLELKELEVMYFHTWDRESYNLRKGVIDTKKIIKIDKESGRESAEKFQQKGWFTEKQKKKFLRGEDIVLYKDEINKIYEQTNV